MTKIATAAPLLDYVIHTAQALALPLDDDRARRVAETLARTAAMVKPLESVAIGPADELAEIFRPAPFPAAQSGSDGDMA